MTSSITYLSRSDELEDRARGIIIIILLSAFSNVGIIICKAKKHCH